MRKERHTYVCFREKVIYFNLILKCPYKFFWICAQKLSKNRGFKKSMTWHADHISFEIKLILPKQFTVLELQKFNR